MRPGRSGPQSAGHRCPISADKCLCYSACRDPANVPCLGVEQGFRTGAGAEGCDRGNDGHGIELVPKPGPLAAHIDLEHVPPRCAAGAVRVDADGRLHREQMAWRLALPLTRPAIVTVAIFTGLNVWNGCPFPLILTQSPDKRVMPLALGAFQGEYSVNVPACWQPSCCRPCRFSCCMWSVDASCSAVPPPALANDPPAHGRRRPSPNGRHDAPRLIGPVGQVSVSVPRRDGRFSPTQRTRNPRYGWRHSTAAGLISNLPPSHQREHHQRRVEKAHDRRTPRRTNRV